MTYEELLDLARRCEGKTLETVTGKKFTVGVSSAENCPFLTRHQADTGRAMAARPANASWNATT